jgi:hypothetical protein
LANNVFQAKRTTVSGRVPNTTASYATNSQYIAAGEFALNMTDQILFTSNGSAPIYIGSNLINQNITGNLTVKGIIANGSLGTAGHVLHTNGTAVYWDVDNTGGGGVNLDSTYAWTNVHTFAANVVFSAGISANGGYGTAGDVLTSNGSVVYWSPAAGGGGVYMKGGSATVGSLGSEGQNIFRVNANTLNYDTTISTGENATATGPISVASGITLTVQIDARVSII